VSGAIDKITGANFFTRGRLELYTLFVDLEVGYFRFLPRHRAIVNREIVKIGINILPEPMILIARARTELQAFSAIVNLTGSMIDIAEVALKAACGADMFGQPLSIYNVLELG
jgi:hypothetical protein